MDMNPIDIDQLESSIQRRQANVPSANFLRIVLEALCNRSLVWTAALAGCLMWGWTVYEPDYLRILSSAAYCMTVLVPILWRDGKE